MEKADVIIAKITARIGATDCDQWHIGLTNDLADQKKYWQENQKQTVACWGDWKTDSLSDARVIESHFINRGMKVGTDADLSADKAVFVYIF